MAGLTGGLVSAPGRATVLQPAFWAYPPYDPRYQRGGTSPAVPTGR